MFNCDQCQPTALQVSLTRTAAETIKVLMKYHHRFGVSCLYENLTVIPFQKITFFKTDHSG